MTDQRILIAEFLFFSLRKKYGIAKVLGDVHLQQGTKFIYKPENDCKKKSKEIQNE